MKVFICERQGFDCGGLAVVAANSVEEAFKTFYEDPDYTKWHSDYYPLKKWFECKVLTANVETPCVIMEDGYSE